METDEFVRMTVGGLTLDPMTKTPIVVLRNDAEELTLPIWIGLLEATAVATQLEGVQMARPMTHDLLKKLVEEVGAEIDRVEVTALRDNTFYAVIRLVFGGKAHVIDSRPSDAISLALRTDSPIYVAREVIEASAAAAEAAEEGIEGEGEGADEAPEAQDISDLAPEEWAEILEGLDPNDFKYKM